MIKIRRAKERGHTDLGWLKSDHTFSFGEYYDPKQMGFSVLRVINDDWVAGGKGFGTHPHSDMEILTYVLEGELQHKDSMGNGSIIRPGEVQLMSAGTGVTHSEFNPSATQSVHLFQIWILPRKKGITPAYQQKAFDIKGKSGELVLIVSPKGKESLRINQDAEVLAGIFKKGQTLSYAFAPNRQGWLQVLDGEVVLDKETLSAGDAVAYSREKSVGLEFFKDSHVLLFDLP